MEMVTAEQRAHLEALATALESGTYQQASGALRKGDCFCCLGVACHVMDADAWERPHSTFDTDAWRFPNPVNWHPQRTTTTELPEKAQAFYGLNSVGSFVFERLPQQLREQLAFESRVPEMPTTLMGLNDAGVPFSTIAKVIRAVWLVPSV